MKKIIAGLVCLAVVLSLAGTVKAEPFKFTAPKGIGADVCYDFRDHAVGLAASVSLATFGKENLCEVRAVYASFDKVGVPVKVGAGIGVSIPKLLTAMGCQGIPEWFASSCGIMALVDFQDNIEVSPAIYLTAIRINW